MENQKEEIKDKEIIIDQSHYVEELTSWLRDKNFLNDRGWTQDGVSFYSFKKGNYRIEAKFNWNLKHVENKPLMINILDCEKEYKDERNSIGWMGQKYLHTFKKPISQTLFNELCEHYGL